MTKKDYVMIANHFNITLATVRHSKDSELMFPYFRAIILDLSNEMKALNPRFDEVKFVKACGLI